MEKLERAAGAQGKIASFQSRKAKKTLFIALMMAYPVAQFLIFWVYVNFDSIMMAFQDASGNFTFEHFEIFFKELGDSNALALNSITNSIWHFIVGDFVGLPVSLIFSYFMFKRVPGSKIFRVVFFLPSIISAVVLTTIYGYILTLDGPINSMITSLGGERIPFLLSDKTVLPSILFYGFWFGMGMNILLISGSIARIPEDIFEYSRLEGVGFFCEFTQIVIPLIFETISSIFLMGAVGMFTTLGPTLLLTPLTFETNTTTIAYFIYYCVNVTNNLNYAAAAGLIFTLVGTPIILGARALLNKINNGIEF